jgi:hypothetical protein
MRTPAPDALSTNTRPDYSYAAFLFESMVEFLVMDRVR